MPDAKAQFIIELLKTGSGAEEAMRSLLGVEAAAKQTREAFATLKETAAAFGLAFGGAELIKSSIEQFVEAEQAVSKLNATLKASGQFTEEYRDSLLEAAGALGNLTATESNAIVAIQAQLLAFGATRQQVQELTPVVLDFARGLGIDARTAAVDLGKALQGNFTMLSRYGIETDELASRQQNLDGVVEQLTRRYGGMAEQFARTASGQMQQAKNAFNDLKQSMGEVVVKGIQPILAGFSAMSEKFTEAIKNSKELKENLLTAFQALAFNPVVALLLRRVRSQEEAAKEVEAPGEPAAPRQTQEEKQALEELADLRKKLLLESMDGELKAFGQVMFHYLEEEREIDKLAAKAGIYGEQRVEETRKLNEAARDFQNAQIQSAINAKLVEQDLSQAEAGEKVIAQLRGFSNVKIGLINEEFRKRREAIEAYYDFEESQAEDNAQQIEQIEAEKTRALMALEERRKVATSTMLQDIEHLESAAAHNFASGFASALGDFVDGTKSAGEAFKEFAHDFLKQTAEMIVQLLIIRALRSVFGAALGGGGQAASAAAVGGMFIAAAGGVPGVEEVNGPTYFPRFNVLAGEAGREVMTVMAKPQTYNMDGLMAQIGNVGPRRLAITDATQLQSRLSATANDGAPGGRALPGGAVGGSAEITVRLEPGLIAEVTNNSIAGAKIQLTQDAARHTPFAAAVKKLTA